MKLKQRHNLPFTTVTIEYRGQSIEVSQVLVDTDSATTVFSVDVLEGIGIYPSPDDIIRRLRGIGGTESVFTRNVDTLRLGSAAISDFKIEVGGMDYGFEINGILGTNFLRPIGAVLNLRKMTLSFDPGA